MKKYKKMGELRVKKGYTLEGLAKKIGITKQYLWDLEDGRRVLSYKMAYKISVALGTTPDKLFLEDHLNNDIKNR
ncbi:MAG: helix-turn-helix transcriptional regulator [Bacilli bacterium]|nr:helix-turn-helix transcriptional regulator [Bacilli bacterium]